MRISTSLPDGKWREVAEAARAFEELGFDEAAAHEVRHDSFATLVPATIVGLRASLHCRFPLRISANPGMGAVSASAKAQLPARRK